MDREIWRGWSVGALSGEVTEGTFLFDLVETFHHLQTPMSTRVVDDLSTTPGSQSPGRRSVRSLPIDNRQVVMKKPLRIERSNVQIVLHVISSSMHLPQYIPFFPDHGQRSGGEVDRRFGHPIGIIVPLDILLPVQKARGANSVQGSAFFWSTPTLSVSL